MKFSYYCHCNYCITVCKRCRQVNIAAYRTPLMTSEMPANHSTSLYGYHDSRTKPSAYNENKRLFGVIYDERKYLPDPWNVGKYATRCVLRVVNTSKNVCCTPRIQLVAYSPPPDSLAGWGGKGVGKWGRDKRQREKGRGEEGKGTQERVGKEGRKRKGEWAEERGRLPPPTPSKNSSWWPCETLVRFFLQSLLCIYGSLIYLLTLVFLSSIIIVVIIIIRITCFHSNCKPVYRHCSIKLSWF